MAYLFPCTCGKEIPLAPRQAGEELTCECGAKHTAPTMREIRQLPSDGDEQPAATNNWSMLQGGIFCCGSVLIIIGVIGLAMLLYNRSKLDTERPEINDDLLAQDLDPWLDSPAKSLELWDNLSTVRLPAPGYEPPWLGQRRLAARNLLECMLAIAGISLGLVLVVVSIAMPTPQPQRRPTRPPPGKKPAGR